MLDQQRQVHPVSEIDRRVSGRLGERTIRYTAARRLVVGALIEASGPQTAAELHQELVSDVPLSSLYRALTVLVEAGVLERTHDAEGVALFELAEWLTGHHHHLVCLECGAVEDVEIPPDREAAMAAIMTVIGGAVGYEVTGHRIDIEGRCAPCRQS